jgi:outer membrane murein-binding lipoprotein Lpp
MTSFSPKLTQKIAIFIVIVAAILSGGCNLTSFMDSPSNDDQYLSAARACLDQGNIQCALNDYAQVSSSDADVANSETALAILDENGAGMSAFMDFVGYLSDNSPGYAINKLAEHLISGAGENKRVAIWTAFNMRTEISTPALSNFVEFIGGLALTAELLAEAGDTQTGIFSQSNLVQDPSGCIAAGFPGCAGSTYCAVPISGYGSNLTATSEPSIATNSPTNTNPSLDQAFDALSLSLDGLANLAPSGKFQSLSNITSAFTDAVNYGYVEPSSAPPDSDECFREAMISNGIGESQ